MEELLRHGIDPMIIQKMTDFYFILGILDAILILEKYGPDLSSGLSITTNKNIIKHFGLNVQSDNTKTFNEVIEKCSECYDFASGFRDENLADLAKNTKLSKNIKVYGDFGRSFKISEPSVSQVMSECAMFVSLDLDMYRNIVKIEFMKETNDEVLLEIRVDNFST
jgi:hypothetical protein